MDRTSRLFDTPSGVRSAAAVAAGALFIALTSQLGVPLGFTPVPVTLQVFGVLAAGLALGPRKGAASAALYLALAVAGAPFWAGGQGGAAYFLASSGPVVAPTLGYLLAFPPAAFVTGWLSQRVGCGQAFGAVAAALAGAAVIHAGGIAWIWAQYTAVAGVWAGLGLSLAQGSLPFVLADIAKAMAAAALFIPCGRRFPAGR